MKVVMGPLHPPISTSFPRRSFTNETTCAKSKFKATKPLLPRFPNNMSGFTTNLEDESQGSFSCSSVKSVDAFILCRLDWQLLARKSLKVLLQQPLGVVLSDLLARHFSYSISSTKQPNRQ
ncbi:hypothetical protein V8G54_017726 [Vigna mungo]|uniref:Uncharacterized protein n=1 Tax=Vigna mungo TaxID=3915 RepID=A0AAQ3NNG5_VIGMU